MHYCAESEFGPYWSVTKYNDIMTVETNHQVFSSEKSISIFDHVQEMNYAAANETALWLIALSFVALLVVYGRCAAERRSDLG